MNEKPHKEYIEFLNETYAHYGASLEWERALCHEGYEDERISMQSKVFRLANRNDLLIENPVNLVLVGLINGKLTIYMD